MTSISLQKITFEWRRDFHSLSSSLALSVRDLGRAMVCFPCPTSQQRTKVAPRDTHLHFHPEDLFTCDDDLGALPFPLTLFQLTAFRAKAQQDGGLRLLCYTAARGCSVLGSLARRALHSPNLGTYLDETAVCASRLASQWRAIPCGGPISDFVHAAHGPRAADGWPPSSPSKYLHP
jgi:hypothetical protein